jgi:hypothetical protein
MLLHAVALLAQLASTQQTLPVLAFPEAGLDDPAAYQGYQTRFFRDAAGNTVQIYLDRREGRAVHVWANAENESIGFSARDGRGAPANLNWNSEGALVSRAAQTRTVEYSLTTDARRIDLGWFLLGSMRVERDFQAAGRHRAPFTAARYTLAELARLIASLERLPSAERGQHLALLGAPDVRTLRRRLHPSVDTRRSNTTWEARVVQPSLDGRDTLVLEVRTDPRRVNAVPNVNSIVLRARGGAPLAFSVRIATTGAALTPVARTDIFTPEFLDFLAAARTAGVAGDSTAIRARWLERQVRGVELLASREKLMAGLPTYGTYFGRDMLVAALMMRPIWRDAMSEFVIASVLRKLSPAGQVSHEEALGGQAVRESAAEYTMLVDAHLRAARRGERAVAESLLVRARAVLRDHRRVRENYHMIDDELQFPVLVARWMGTSNVSLDHQRTFLRDSSDGGATRLVRLLRELALVARMTEAYAREPSAANLVSFAARDSGRWASTSWRDSNAGYGGGRYAMDVNAIWVPHALQSMERILAGVRALGFSIDSLATQVPELRGDAPIARYARDSLTLRRAIDVWRGAWRHFLVRLGPADVRTHVAARLAAMPPVERAHWTAVLASTRADQDSLAFLALALDGSARPIGIANSDPGTRLFLGELERTGARGDSLGIDGVLRDVQLFVRAYPVGLFIDRVGPVVANDAFAPPAVWRAFERDPYHGPRVAWGREVNLFLLGVANRIEAARGAGLEEYVRELRAAADRVVSAVEASGFQSELWSYRFEAGRPVPVRYGSGADVQLWSTTDLAVQFALSRLQP